MLSPVTQLIIDGMKPAMMRDLFTSGAFKIAEPDKPFKLASGRESDYYVNCRQIVLMPGSLYRLATTFIEMIHDVSYKRDVILTGTGVSGRALVGAILAAAACEHPNWRGLVIRDDVKDHGLGQRYEGFSPGPNADIHVVDDVLTSGSSTLKLAQQIYGIFNGAWPKYSHVVVDREEGGHENLEVAHIESHAILTVKDLVQFRDSGGVNAKTDPDALADPARQICLAVPDPGQCKD